MGTEFQFLKRKSLDMDGGDSCIEVLCVFYYNSKTNKLFYAVYILTILCLSQKIRVKI